MAEVTRGTSGLHSLSSKKPPNFSSNGFTVSSSSSSSSKHIYDDVFASRPSLKLKSSEFSRFGDDDFAEIFGCSKSEDGRWESSVSSIPIFNLPGSEHTDRGFGSRGGGGGNGGGIDYSGVFGSSGDGSFGLPDGEELFNQLKKKAKTSASASVPRSKEQTAEATRSHISRQSENGQRPTRGFSQSFDSMEHLEHHIEMAFNEPNDVPNVAGVHDIPGSTCRSHEIGPSQKTQDIRTPMIKKVTEVGMGVYLAKEGKHSRNTSSTFGASEQKREHDAGFQKASCFNESNSTGTSHETCQASTIAGPGELVKEGPKVQFDVKDDARVDIRRSTSSHEVGPSQKTQTHRTPMTEDNAEHGIEISLVNRKAELLRNTSSQKTETNRTPMTEDNAEHGINVSHANSRAEPLRNTNSELGKGEPSMNTSLELGAKEWKGEHDARFQKASGLSGSSSVATLHDSCQANTTVAASKVVKDDAKVEFDSDYIGMDAGPSDSFANKQTAESDAMFQKASVVHESKQIGTSHDTCQASSVVGSAEMVKDEGKAAASFDVGKKQGRRHARMTSLDLGDHRQGNAGSLPKSRFGSSYSFDASHDPFAARVKVQPSKVLPSSSLPQFFPVENHCKISENSNYKISENNLYRGAGGSPPSLDEQLDANSVAAISAAALQRAIEEAEIRIRLAKEFLEREGQGNSKFSFKDTLKLKVGKENNNANEINEYRQKKVQHLPDNRMRTCSHSEKQSVLDAAQVHPAFEGQKKFTKDEEPVEGKHTKVSKPIEEDDKREGGGEWEATKHLNQLISGVKSRIASFMTWQVETEKKGDRKEEPKETEASMKCQQQSQSKQEIKDAEVFEMKEGEMNQCASVFTYETKDGENKTGFIPEVIERDEKEYMQCNTVVQEKAGQMVDVVPDNEGPTKTNFLFFTFNSERSWGHTHPEVGEKRKTEGNGDLRVEHKEKEDIDEVKDQQIEGKSEEANEGLDDVCMSQDCGNSLRGPRTGESDGIVEEQYSVTGYDKSKLTCEENNDRMLYDKCEDDSSEITHEDNHDSRLGEECEDDRRESTYQENRKLSERFGDDDSGEFTYQEDEGLNDEYRDNKSEHNYEEDRQTNEECEDDRSEFTHLENKRLSEECGVNSSEFIHKEDTRMNEELRVDQRNFTYEENSDGWLTENCGSDQSDFTDEEIDDRRMNEECGEEPINRSDSPEAIVMSIETDNEMEDYEVFAEAEDQLDNREPHEEADHVDEIGTRAEVVEESYRRQENERDQGPIDDTDEVTQRVNGLEENKRDRTQDNHTEETENKVAGQVGGIVADDECKPTENGFLSEAEESCGMDGSNSGVEETVIPDEKSERMMEINNSSSEPELDSETTVFPDNKSENMIDTVYPSSEPKKDVEHPAFDQDTSELIGEERVLTSLSTKNTMEFEGIVHRDGTDGALPCENFMSHNSESDLNCGQKDIDEKGLESTSEEIWENQTEQVNESAETEDVGEAPYVSVHVEEKCSFEAGHRRRRWFENDEKVGNADRPSILQGDGANLEIGPEGMEESDLAGSVEIRADKLESETSKVTTATESGSVLNQEDNRVNFEVTHKRRRWLVNRGGEGIPEPPRLFRGIKVTSEMDPGIVNESEPHVRSDSFVDHLHTKSGSTLTVSEADEVVTEEKGKQSVEATPRRKRWFESGEKVGLNQQQRRDEDGRMSVDVNQEHKETGDTERSGVGKDDIHDTTEPVNEVNKDRDAVNRRKKEREKERIAVERAIREARERAFAEARERARREAVEKPKMEGSQRGGSGVQDRIGKTSSEATTASDKASTEAKLRAERAAVERATAEARERALQKALSEKASHRLREPAGRHQPERSSSFDPKYHSSGSYRRGSDPSNKGVLNTTEKLDVADNESAQRRKARLERQKRTMERAAKALEEKNTRDLQAQKEQAARNMLADVLDAEVKRWSSGKEGNLRALLSTLQYILGSDSGWQAISLIDLVAPTAVRKAYKKATLCVHPDKLQQRGASIQQKYICEKVFDLLKDAWSKFNPDDL